MIGFHLAHDLDAIDGLTHEVADRGGNVFAYWLPESPDFAVAVLPSGGQPQMTGLADDKPTVQIIGRGDPFDEHAILATMGAIYARLNCRDGFELTGATNADGDELDPVWVSGCTAMQSDPIPLGRDPLGRPRFALNFALLTHNPTTHRS